MVPRAEIIAVDRSIQIQKVKKIFEETGLQRFLYLMIQLIILLVMFTLLTF